MKILKNNLKAKGLRPTFHRLKVLEYIYKNRGNHPTVEMIYNTLKKEIPTISMTTIYNTLNALLEKGIVSSVIITGTEIRCDHKISPHHHFHCKRCGKIFDVDHDFECPFLTGKKKTINGHKIEEMHGCFKGICKNCSKS